jgi:hypothetical protein
MLRQSISLISAVFVLALGAGAQAGIEGYWKLDEGSGTVAGDSSGNGRDGIVSGAAWASPGWDGAGFCLDFDGQGTNRVSLGTFSVSGNAISLACWFKADNLDTPGNDPRMISKAIGGSNDEHYFMVSSSRQNNIKVLRFRLKTDGTTGELKADTATGTIELDVWTHVAATWDGQTMRIYKNGEEVGSLAKSGSLSTDDTAKVSIGNQPADTGGDRPFDGLIDEVLVADRAMTAAQAQALAAGILPDWRKASDPDPADGALHGATWVNLSWTAGETAVSHDVYLGENPDDVRDGAGDTFRGNYGSAFIIAGFAGFPLPDGLVNGTTYYWRVDEVEADGVTVIKGNVWSFMVPPRKAYDPNPADGAEFVAQDVELSWTTGFDAKVHTVYFGDDADAVGSATGGMGASATTHTPGSLESNKTYYWRVDEFDGFATHKGDVWSFMTIPNVTVTDSSLLGWWKLDEGQGMTAVDWSGHGNHGALNGTAQWAQGYDGGALDLEYDDTHDGVAVKAFDVGTGGITLTAWVKPETFAQNDGRIITKATGTNSNDHLWMLSTIANGPDYTLRFRLKTNDGQDTATLIADDGALVAGQWTHAAATWDGTTMIIYKDGVEVARGPKTGTAVAANPALGVSIGNHLTGTTGNRAWDGLIDDVRVYDKTLSFEELQQAMRGDPFVAWGPSPSSGATVGLDDASPLNWSPGDNASQHDVYFGTDKDAVAAADTSTAYVYRGRQSSTGHSPTEGAEWGGGPYYWRIDEFNTDGTISKGRLWSFEVADFVPVEDFESYTDDDAAGEAIWQSWIDGFGVATNGSQVGYMLPPYAEQIIVHGGGQSMPLSYNNAAGITNSEAELRLDAPRDWTRHGVGELSLWFRGNPASVGGFVEGPVGTYTMTATGADIWNDADAFHYAYRTLSGVGSIEAQVLSVQNTNAWAKAGVMIRDTLDANSKFAAVYITPGNGCSFQGRVDTGIGASSDTAMATDEQKAVTAPYWVKLERDAGGNFRGYYSSNGTTWQPMTWNPPAISMNATVYVGLSLTSHNNNATCEAKFSNVRTTGTVGPQWASQDIGIASNATEPLYVAISNSTGAPAVVAHHDPDAATTVTWTEWVIDLQQFANQGIDLTDIDKIAIGLGSKSNMVGPGGSGLVYFDDFRLYRPRNVGP